MKEENISSSHHQLLSEELNQFISRRPHWVIGWANTVFLTLFILLVVLSWYIRYPETISVPVQVSKTSSGAFYGELRPSAGDMSRIREGQPVTIRLEGQRGREMARLRGRTGQMQRATGLVKIEMAPGESPMPGTRPAAYAEIVVGNKRLITSLLGRISPATP